MHRVSLLFLFLVAIISATLTSCLGSKPGASKDDDPHQMPLGQATTAVDLIGAWVNSGAPETETFEYTGSDGEPYIATFDADILPLFTQDGAWGPTTRSCSSCHFDNTDKSTHKMDLSSYRGMMKGGDVASAPLFGQSKIGATDYDWAHSKMRARLRNNRMPPGMPFDIDEGNLDGPELDVNGTKVKAVDLMGAWVDAGAPETAEFGPYKATFPDNVLPLFTENGIWYPGTRACASCHFDQSENSYHEMDLSSYAGILQGGGCPVQTTRSTAVGSEQGRSDRLQLGSFKNADTVA